MTLKGNTIEERLEFNSERRGDCLIWIRAHFTSGYGCIVYKGHSWRVHSLKWTLVNEEVPKGFNVLHTCSNKDCHEITHLWLGTHTDNMRDASHKHLFGWQVTLKEHAEIKRLAAAGLNDIQIGRILGLHRITVGRHRRGYR